MWQRLKYLWQTQRAALCAFVLCVLVAGYFGGQALSRYIYWADPRHQDQPLADWMTPRYVVQSYDVPPEVIQTALGLALDEPPRRISLGSLAAAQGKTLTDLQAQVTDAVTDWRSTGGNGRP